MKLNFPLFVTNAKTYPQISGDGVLDLALVHERVAMTTHTNLALAVSPLAVGVASAMVEGIHIFSQHVDACTPGRNTGHLTAETTAWAGATGVIINHSEHRLADADAVKAHIVRAQAAGLAVIVCAESADEVATFAAFKPEAIAYEPPELIGGAGASVAAAKPEVIAQSVDAAGDVPLLVGAGVSTEADIVVSLQLGAQGFLVASAIVKSDDPQAALERLAGAMRV